MILLLLQNSLNNCEKARTNEVVFKKKKLKKSLCCKICRITSKLNTKPN